MTTAALAATEREAGPGRPEARAFDAEPLMPGETGQIDDIPDGVWRRLTATFDADQIEKLPRVICWKCTDNKRHNRPETCDEHPRKVRCTVCGQRISAGHIHLDYVGHAGITMRLNEVLTPAGWNWRPMALTPAGTPLLSDGGMWILLTIGGVTRIGFGDAGDKPMTTSAIKEIIGDGIRNAAMRFGIATYLWSKSNAAEQLKNLPTEPEEDYATSLAAATDSGELYKVAARLKRAVDAGTVSEALAVLLRRAFYDRRAALDSEQQHSPIRLPDDHWETTASAQPVETLTAATQIQHQTDTPDSANQNSPAASGLTTIPALADVEVEPPRARGEREDFFASLNKAKNLDAVERVEARFTDRFHGSVINATLFVDLAIAAAARRTELGGVLPAMSPASAALASILARAGESTRSHKDIGRIHALVQHHAGAGTVSPDEAEALMAGCRAVYRTVFTQGQTAESCAA